MEGCTSPVFKFQEEALGKDNIKLVVVDESDNLDFVGKNDIVLLRTASKSLVDTIRKKRIKSTAEDYASYQLALNKVALMDFLMQKGIDVPRQYSLSEIADRIPYFVKPRGGSDSKIPNQGICFTKKEVECQVQVIKETFGQDAVIEDYIPGIEYTVACTKVGNCIHTYPIDIDCPCRGLSRREIDGLDRISINTFVSLGLKHHARIDIRANDYGVLFVIDVNLIPGLGPSDKWANCMEAYEMSYTDSLREVIASAY